MTTADLFERRATRGTPRGAAAVWRDAHVGVAAASEQRPTWRFRIVLAAWVVLLLVGVFAVRLTDDAPAPSTATPEGEGDTPTSSEPLPAPLLIEGGSIAREGFGVTRPSDPDYDADDLFGGGGRLESLPDAPITTAKVYARELDPFAGPIVVIETLSAGGFRPLGANISRADLARYSALVERVEGSWTLDSKSGLVEVASIVDDWNTRLTLRWHFAFELPGRGWVMLSAQMGTPEFPVDEWLMISRLAVATADTGGLAVAPTEVLGSPGVVIDTGNGSGNEVVWTDGDVMYRLNSSTIEGDTVIPRNATDDVGRLRLVERSEWVDAIRASFDVSIAARIAGFALFPTLMVAIVTTVWFLVRRSVGAAAIAAFVAAMLWWMGGIGAIEVSLAWIGLVIAWWRHRSARASKTSADTNPEP